MEVHPSYIERAKRIVEREHGEHDENAIREAHHRAALADPLYKQLDVLFGDRIIATRPHRTLYAEVTRIGSLVKPQGISERIKTNKEYVLECTVLRIGTGVCKDDVAPGDRVIVSQFAGSIWYDVVRGRESELWLFASGDVLLKLLPEVPRHASRRQESRR